MKEYIDLEGLTTQDPEQYAFALNLNGEKLLGEQRISILISLRETSNQCVVYTGPQGAPYWSLVSQFVTVKVVPDNYEYTYRTTDEETWSLIAAGFSVTEARRLQARPPTDGNPRWERWQRANDLRNTLRSLPSTTTGVSSKAPATSARIIYGINEQLNFIQCIPPASALDYEWTIDKQELIGLNVSLRDKTDWYLPVLGRDFNQSAYAENIRLATANIVRSRQTVWHNAKADIQSQFAGDPLDYFGSPIHDTMLMAYLAGEQELDLKSLTKKLLGRHAQKLPDKLELQPVEVAAKYGAEGDTRNTLDLFDKLKARLEATGQWEIYDNLERPLIPVVASMEKYGSPVDMQAAISLRNDYYEMEKALESLVQGHGFQFSSESGQRDYVTRHYGSDLGTLDKRILARVIGEWMDTLIGYRQIKTLRRNFLDRHIAKWRALGEPETYSLYPRFNQAGRDTGDAWLRAPATGRFSSAEPNLQNQPREIRSIFTAPAGMLLCSLDYSKLEMVVAAALSGDPVMLDALRSGDIHSFMQARILSETGINVSRTAAKNANFNLRYGGYADMLMTIAAKERAHLDYDTAKVMVDLDHSTYQGYWRWYDLVVSNARRDGYSQSLRGRRRYNADLFSSDDNVRGHAERAAANMAVQGTAADIIKEAMLRLVPVLHHYEAHLSVQVHDSLTCWVPEDAAKRFLIAAVGVMQDIKIPHLPLSVHGGLGKTWAEAESA